MNFRLFLQTIVMGLCSNLLAQTTAPLENLPLPSGPLIGRTANEAQWQIDYFPPDVPPAPTTTPAGTVDGAPTTVAPTAVPPSQPLIKQVSVTKSSKTYHRIVHFASGKDQEEWWIGGLQASQIPDVAGFTISNDISSETDYNDFTKTDFPLLKWINASTYVGVQTVGEAKCLVFKTKIPSTPEEELVNLPPEEQEAAKKDTMEVMAWINLSTHLPVQYTTPSEKQVYTFLPPPAAPLVVPPAIATQIAEWRKSKATAVMMGPRP